MGNKKRIEVHTTKNGVVTKKGFYVFDPELDISVVQNLIEEYLKRKRKIKDGTKIG